MFFVYTYTILKEQIKNELLLEKIAPFYAGMLKCDKHLNREDSILK